MILKTLPGIFLVVFLFIFVFSSTNVFATSPQIFSYPNNTIGLDQAFVISATMSGLSKTSLYRLRIALAQTGTSNYFGSTWNGSYWYNGTPSPINYADFLSITTDSTGAWWGDIQGEIDANDPNFTTGSGTYDLKVGRYTQTGTSATWSDPVSVVVSIPPQPTDTPAPLTATPTPITPTPTPRSINSPISKPSVTSIKNTPTSMFTAEISTFGAVLGTGSAISPAKANTPTLVAAVADHKETKIELLPILLILAGFGLLGGCGILIALHSEKGKLLWKRFF